MGTRQDFYSDPALYDLLHAPGTANDARAIVQLVRRHVPGARRGPLRLFEPASGSGRYLIALARAGHECVGIDINPGMVRYANAQARAHGLAARARSKVARMEAFTLPSKRFHGAFNLINSIRHVTSDTAMVRHLQLVRDSLVQGGVYVVGISLCAYGIEQETEDTWLARKGRHRVTQVVQYLPPSLKGARSSRMAHRSERVISHVVDESPAGTRHVDSSYVLRSYNLRQWRMMIAKAGMCVIGVTDQHGEPVHEHEPGYFLFVLQRRAPR